MIGQMAAPHLGEMRFTCSSYEEPQDRHSRARSVTEISREADRALEGYRTCPNGPRTVWRDCYSKVFQARDDKTIGAWQGLQNVLVIFGDPDVIAATSRSDFELSVVARQPTTLVVGR
jgi:hypothetical protein